MDRNRIARLRRRVLSSPPRSKDREEIINSLSGQDLDAVFQLDADVRAGRVEEPSNIENVGQEGNSMTYETFKRLSDGDEHGAMRRLSEFAMKSPKLYEQFREKYQAARDEALRLHNRRLNGW